ncbi:hypothetical protein [Allorhizobium taibaishanense]|uniref:Uncharacterized protein n=1 Tax=Allorhizobium taibaishanense TaxID=887144 RepID=A0A1Q9A2P2_9HYPH|nr:hypothetical protein [Allorhizobium taibaishanense]MBB4005781.1 hypothetical protein [Allorhizobium taibaishanense]OLP48829.1 hypothetical protein BJF91_16985 [Allorhizobium taibaishanense]
MATTNQFLGTNWTTGAALEASWQWRSGGTMSPCGTITVNSISDFEVDLSVNVTILSGTFDNRVIIKLLDQLPEATTGPAQVAIGSQNSNVNYFEGPAHNPGDFHGGNAIKMNGIEYNHVDINIQIWPVGEKTLLYIDSSYLSFWLAA